MAASRKSTLPAPTLALIVAAVMVVLYGIDKFLADQEQSELMAEAHNHYTRGGKLLNAGKAHEAVAEFARARSLERSNREYPLALATALLADHQPTAAGEILTDALDEDSNDGRANLLMARVLVAEGKFKDADSYYHRAIYGEWPPSSSESGKVRLELASLLAEHGNHQELLSEVLLLQINSATDPAAQKQIAALFLQAGSAQRAAETYRQMIRDHPDDIDAHLGLARSEEMADDYRAAENAVMAAIHLRPYDRAIQLQLRQVVRLASLDPTSRRLSTAEKYRRSMEILRLVREELAACGQTSPPARPQATAGPVTNEIAEACLDQAANLWEQRVQVCKQPPAPDDPLPLLIKKLQ
jgi:tetratricopeptide (TPR) repeat protein